jgi:LPS export ABC transporter protein LptC
MADGNPPPERPAQDRHAQTDAVWQPRPQIEVEKSVAEYSRVVARLKVALPVAAGLILLLIFVLPQIRSESERFRIGLKNVTDIANDTLSMVNARYFGTDDNGEPFVVTAQKVHERSEPDANGSKLIDLTAPRAELNTNDGKHAVLTATSGIYDRKDEVLDLAGQVDLTQGDYEMHTTAARIRLKDSTASGDAPVTAKGSFGDIQSKGFIARQNDRVLIFTGPATLVLKGKTETPTETTDAKPGETGP